MSQSAPALRVLHVLPPTGAQSWAEQAADFIGLHNKGLSHWVACQDEGVWRAAAIRLPKAAKVSQPLGFPDLGAGSGIRALQNLAQAMRSFDLILTYGEGGLKAAMAHALFGPGLGLGPLVHHIEPEPANAVRSGLWSGFWRNWYRMIALSRASAVIAPSRPVAEKALRQWRQPADKVHHVPRGVDTAACAARPKANALPRVIKRDGELWIGTAGGSLSGLAELLSCLPTLGDQWQLVVLGQISARDGVLAEAIRLEVGHRVHLPGAVENIASVMGLFDLFAVPDGVAAEQADVTVKQAMAAGLAVTGHDSVRELLSPENAAILVKGDPLAALARDAVLRQNTGSANRSFARANYDLKVTMTKLAAVYASALGRDRLPA